MQRWIVRGLPIIYGLMHAVVDAASAMVVFAALLLHRLPPVEAFYLVIVYDLLAFGLQVFFGAATDRLRRPKVAVLLGLGLLAAGTVMLTVEPISAAVLAGLGNAAFHVGGGVISLRMQPDRATAPGVFVAPGAIGLAFGIWVGKSGWSVAWPFALALLISMVVTVLLPRPPYPYALGADPEAPGARSVARVSHAKLVVALLLFSIVVRSLVGMAGSYRCPKEAYVMFGLALAAVGGKALGGMISDRLGWLETSVGALLLSAPLIVFGGGTWWVLIAGMLLFQMTMPVTLAAVALVQPKRPGFAFGLTCLALILGAIPTFYSEVRAYYHPYAFAGLILLSAGAVYFGLRLLGDANPVKGILSGEPERS